MIFASAVNTRMIETEILKHCCKNKSLFMFFQFSCFRISIFFARAEIILRPARFLNYRSVILNTVAKDEYLKHRCFKPALKVRSERHGEDCLLLAPPI